jgi:hypothetical protein
MRKASGDALKIGEDPVTALLTQPSKRIGKDGIIVHG